MSAKVGAAHHFSKITEADVRAMRSARKAGKSVDEIHEELGRPLGISHSNTEKIVLGLAWKHVC